MYISKKDYDSFFRWLKQLHHGVLSTPPVNFSHIESEIRDPLRVSLDTNEYYLITDAKEDLKNLENIYGSLEINYEPDSQELHLQRIKESIRNASREDLVIELVYAALAVMKDLPDLTPSEAVIIAERSVLGSS